MGFIEWVNRLFGTKKLDHKTEEFIEEAEKIEPGKPLNYNNEPEDVVVDKKGMDL